MRFSPAAGWQVGKEPFLQVFVKEETDNRIDTCLGKTHPNSGGEVPVWYCASLDKHPPIASDYVGRP